MKKPATSSHAVDQAARSRAAFRSVMGPSAEARREEAIAALPVLHWRGQILYSLRCQNDRDRPHTVNVAEALLWALIDLRFYHCPYHNAPEEKPR